MIFFNLEKERRERKLRGNEMRRKYGERSLPTANNVEESKYSLIINFNYSMEIIKN